MATKKSDKAKSKPKKPAKGTRGKAKGQADKAPAPKSAEAPKKRGPGRPRKAKSGDGRRPAGTTLEKAVELAEKKKGVTFTELMKFMGSKTKGPMVRSINSGVERGVLTDSGEKRGGETLYVLGPVSIDAPRPRRKRGRKPKAAKAVKLETAIAQRAAGISADGPHIPLEWVVAFNRAFEAFVRELANSSER